MLLVASRLTTRAIDFCALMVLAKTLTPADFGLISIAMTLIYITEAVFELPLAQSLLRLEVVSDEYLNTAFTISLSRGLGLSLVIIASALPFAYIYGDDRLIPLIMFLTIAPAVRGLMSPAMVHFARQLDFRRDMFIELIGKSVGFVASTYVAYTTHSYWAIAIGTVLSPLVMMIESYVIAPYRPRLSLRNWRAFASFLGWTSAAQALSALNWQADKLILGRFAARASLGNFSMASDLASVPDQVLVAPIIRPLMAGFVNLRGDTDRLRLSYQQTSVTLLAVAAPAMTGVSLLADLIVQVFLGPAWISAVPVLRLLALAPIFSIWVAPLDALAMSLDHTDVFFKQRLIELIVKSAALVFFIASMGLLGAAVARVLGNAIMMVVSMLFVRNLIGLTCREQIIAGWRVILSTAVMSLAVAATLRIFPTFAGVAAIASIAVYSLVGGMAYVVSLYILWHVAGRPDGLERILLSRLRRPTSSLPGDKGS